MRILHVETGMHLYGGARQVAWLVSGLADAGIENLLVCPEGSAVAAGAYGAGVEVAAVPMGGDLDFGFISRLARLIERYGPDLVHLHSRRGADWLGALAARRCRRPAVLTRRVTNPEPPWVVPVKYKLYQRVIAISQAIADGLTEAGVRADKIRLVHSAVPPAAANGWERARFLETFDLPSDAVVVGMAAQFIRRKGHDVLIRALPALRVSHPDLRFLLFGKGPLFGDVRRQLEAGFLDDRVSLIGFRDDFREFIGCLDLLVHPALDEGLGVVLLEAAAAGVPVVATPVGGIPEIVRDGETGLLVPPEDPAALARAIHQLIDDAPARRAMGEAGRRLVDESFSIHAMVEGNHAVYREVLA
jgi:glycosyltransferase involved in cell wall biosynthesis